MPRYFQKNSKKKYDSLKINDQYLFNLANITYKVPNSLQKEIKGTIDNLFSNNSNKEK